ncbi:MAG: OmpA family protein [Planctomycetes bacterium]|nr:OmpA family protein [Planctomycetota bacterium]
MHATSLLGGLLLALFASSCTQKYALQKEADDRLIASLRDDNKMLREELEEARAENASSQALIDEQKRLAGEALADRDRMKGELDSQAAKRASEADELNRNNKLAGVTYSQVPGGIMITVDNEVTFDPGKADISGQGQSTLRELSKVIKQRYPNRRVWVKGHTDDTPIVKSPFKSNLHLSVARSLSVIEYLSEKCGVSDDDLVCVGHGEFSPAVKAKTEVARSKNRRVELLVSNTD